MNDVTRILSAIEHGDPQAAEQLLPLVYDELRKLAAPEAGPGEARPDAPGHGPGPRGLPPAGRRRRGPALGQPRPLLRRRGRGHAPDPRRERPRARGGPKHGGDRQRVDLDEAELRHRAAADDLLALDEALTKLAGRGRRPRPSSSSSASSPACPSSEAAEALGISAATADRRLGLRHGPGSAADARRRTAGAAMTNPMNFSSPVRHCRAGFSHWHVRTRPAGGDRAMSAARSSTKSDLPRGRRASTRRRQRPAYLDQACGDDAELRRRVEQLLEAHEQAGELPRRPRPRPRCHRRPASELERPGTVDRPLQAAGADRRGRHGRGLRGRAAAPRAPAWSP